MKKYAGFGRCKSIVLLLSFLLSGCVTALPPLPPVPTTPIEKVRQSITVLTAPSETPVLPDIKKGPLPNELDCRRAPQGTGVWICTGGPPDSAGGKGLFFVYEGSAEELRQHLAAERVLRELIPVLQSRLDTRDRALRGMMDLLDTMVLMAEEYRAIAELRGEEITRLQRDRIVDRMLLIPIVGLGLGAVYLIAR